MYIFVRKRQHRRCRRCREDSLCGVRIGGGVDFEHGDIDAVAPFTADPAGVDGGGEGVGVVAVDVRAPERATGADLFALGFAEVEAGDADG